MVIRFISILFLGKSHLFTLSSASQCTGWIVSESFFWNRSWFSWTDDPNFNSSTFSNAKATRNYLIVSPKSRKCDLKKHQMFCAYRATQFELCVVMERNPSVCFSSLVVRQKQEAVAICWPLFVLNFHPFLICLLGARWPSAHLMEIFRADRLRCVIAIDLHSSCQHVANQMVHNN